MKLQKIVDILKIVLKDNLHTKDILSSVYNILHKRSFMRKLFSKWVPHVLTVFFNQDHAPRHKSIVTMAKLNKLGFQLLIHPRYSPDLALGDYYLFAILNRMLQEKKIGKNEIISETEALLGGLDKFLYKKDVEMLESVENSSRKSC